MAATICPRPTLTFDLLTMKSVWESHVQSFVFLGLLVFELEPMYATSDGRTTDGGIIRWEGFVEKVGFEPGVKE